MVSNAMWNGCKKQIGRYDGKVLIMVMDMPMVTVVLIGKVMSTLQRM